MYTIGEFSRISKLSIKTLRFYHEQGILIPEQISDENSYRLYGQASIEIAVRINQLKTVGFSLGEIKTIFGECREEEDLILFLQKKRQETEDKIRKYSEMDYRLQAWEQMLRNVQMTENYELKDITREEMLIAAVQIQGKYSDIGKGFSLLFKKAGSSIQGKAFGLYHDLEYKEKDAVFEACFQVKKAIDQVGIDCRTIKAGRVISMLHKGPYGTQGSTYAQIFDYCQRKGLKPVAPLVEVYHKGPGMLFKGNPDKYLTEIQVVVE